MTFSSWREENCSDSVGQGPFRLLGADFGPRRGYWAASAVSAEVASSSELRATQ
jgi:hypothetical protein